MRAWGHWKIVGILCLYVVSFVYYVSRHFGFVVLLFKKKKKRRKKEQKGKRNTILASGFKTLMLKPKMLMLNDRKFIF